MTTRTRRWIPCLAMIATGILLVSHGLTVAAEGPLTWRSVTNKSVALLSGERVVWQFNYSTDQNKAYFHPVALRGGPILSWDRPPDHVWHHALWFSWKFLNQVNYWEIDPQTGKPAGRTAWSNVKIDTREDFSAIIAMDLAFIDPSGTTVMTGTHSIEISPPDNNGQYNFDWTCSFTAGEGDVKLDRTPLPSEPNGVAWGGYAGLSFRFAKDLTDRQAITGAGPITFKAGRFRGKATAMDYNGTINSKPVGVAICDHPSNLNYPTPWYAIADNMSYFSPAVICNKPFVLPAEESFTLRYRVIVHPGQWNAAQVEQEHANYVKTVGSQPKRSPPF